MILIRQETTSGFESGKEISRLSDVSSHMARMTSIQGSLFRDPAGFPEGFRYKENFLSPDQERALIASFKRLPFREFEFRGFLGKSRTVSFGWRYDFNVRELQQAEQIPTFLLALRQEGGEVCRPLRRSAPTRARNRVCTGRGHRLAQRPSRIRRRDWHIARCTVPVPIPSQGRARGGSAHQLSSSPARHTSSGDQRAGTGSTASRQLTSFAIPSPSEACVSRIERCPIVLEALISHSMAAVFPIGSPPGCRALAAVITEAIVHHYGRDEMLRRLAHPFWFQSFGAVMGMDWHSSGITTSVIGALKRGLSPIEHELGIHVCGGRGKHSRQTPHELVTIGERVGFNGGGLG